MLMLIEGIAMCSILLITCVIGIANGPIGLVVLYEKDVRERVIELGLAAKKKINRAFAITAAALYIPVLALTPLMVYFINGADGFLDGFFADDGYTSHHGTF